MARILVLGGLANSLVNFRGALLAEMVRRGHEVIGCAAEDCPEVAEQLAAMGVRYVPLHFKRAGLNPFSDLLLLFRLVKLLRRLRPDIVLAYTIKPVIYGSLACRLLGVQRCYSMITGLGYAFMGGVGLRQRLVGKVAPPFIEWRSRGMRACSSRTATTSRCLPTPVCCVPGTRRLSSMARAWTQSIIAPRRCLAVLLPFY